MSLSLRIPAATLEPLDIFVACDVGIFAVDALAGPIGCPVGSVVEKLRGAKSIRQHDAESAFVGGLPQLEDAVLRSSHGGVVIVGRQCGEDHGDFVGVGSNGFQIMLMGEKGIGSSGESGCRDSLPWR